LNGGTCDTSSSKCICPSGFTGNNCENDPPIPPGGCSHDNHCGRYGKCINGKCVCEDGFTGNSCQHPPEDPPDDCGCCTADYHCNSGSCVDGSCVCKNGYTGDHCTVPPELPRCQGCPCSIDSHCYNGGSCIENNATSINECQCINGFTGDSCEIPPFDDPNPNCENVITLITFSNVDN
jgi:syndecan 4